MIRLGRKRQRRSFPGIAYLDLLVNLLFVFVVLVALTLTLVKPSAGKPTIETLGTVAVVMTWPEADNSDIDLWVQAPDGQIAYFGNPSITGLFLEHDDLAYFKVAGEKRHYERMIVQQSSNGEYVVNSMLYRKGDPTENRDRIIPITITLWRLRGNDEVITTKHLTLLVTGEEKTAFRFTLNKASEISGINTLQKKLLGHEKSRPVPVGTGFAAPPGSGGN